MTGQGFRTDVGGRIDRSKPIRFTFDGRWLQGYAGDTVASALLANGVRLAARSFKYHRPRGVLSAGVDEPNVLIEASTDGGATTNLRATEVMLSDGLAVRSLNRWPSLAIDITSVNNLAAPFLAAGFYYKTFMWPSWALFEGIIRRAAGIGVPSKLADAGRYETRFGHCDVLVIGSGPAGLAAARAAAADKVRVILVEQDTQFGGSLLSEDCHIDGQAGDRWADAVVSDLARKPDVRLIRRATAIGYYDHNEISVVERPENGRVRERLWQIRAKRVVLATGAIERPLVFPGNDRPGVIMASAARTYARRFGVLAGRDAVVFTNNDTAYECARVVMEAGLRIAAIVDTRPSPPSDIVAWWAAKGVEMIVGSQVNGTRGGHALRRVCVRRPDGSEVWISCDSLLMSGGWNPTVHLFSQSGGRLGYDEDRALFRPLSSAQAEQSAGAANGVLSLSAALAEGHQAGANAALLSAGERADVAAPATADRAEPGIAPCWQVAGRGKAFVDFQNDVTASDIALAARENFTSVEHLKRYTTLGMAPDQGKTSNVNALAIMGEVTGRSPGGVGTTRYRPPFTATSLSAFSGRHHGKLFRPYRRSPMHGWHAEQGAVFEDFGGWQRPAFYPRPGEGHEATVRREALAVRTAAGLFDGSPLGKIEVSGPDAARFLDLIYANTMSSLKPGRIRYGLMLNELGVVIDDGVAARLAEDRFLLSTTSGGAERIADWLEEWLQCEWTNLKVSIAPLTSAFGVITLTGPKARQILQALPGDIDLSADDFKHMCFREGLLDGVPVRISRVSFTGEVSFEINVPTNRALDLWRRIADAGASLGVTPIGIDAWTLLRTEKGYLHIGADTDGTTVPGDIGWGHVVKKSVDFIGKRSLLWEFNRRPDRLQFVGLVPIGTADTPAVGSRLGSVGGSSDEGYISSSGFSPTLGRPIGLGLVRGGRERIGEELLIGQTGRRVRIAPPAAYDPEGARLDG